MLLALFLESIAKFENKKPDFILFWSGPLLFLVVTFVSRNKNNPIYFWKIIKMFKQQLTRAREVFCQPKPDRPAPKKFINIHPSINFRRSSFQSENSR